ncbi:hypothetical protein [Roseivivax lentus]|uniref:hypothetical protein n=1 Tax=Roseivivax lentus TaxID=633194 RepID=UPI00117B4057|nr:hypothetical protein [Roseivivax lentus]
MIARDTPKTSVAQAATHRRITGSRFIQGVGDAQMLQWLVLKRRRCSHVEQRKYLRDMRQFSEWLK